MADVTLDEKLVEEGKLWAILGRASKKNLRFLIGDGDPLESRARVQGVLEGLLATGKWERALQIVYNDTATSAFFQGNYRIFHANVLAAAADAERSVDVAYVANKDTTLIETIINSGEPSATDLVYGLFTELNAGYGYSFSRRVLRGLKGLTKEQKKVCEEVLGHRACGQRDFWAAYHHYHDAGATEREDETFDTLTKNFDPSHFSFLERFAKGNTAREQKLVDSYLLIEDEVSKGENIGRIREIMRNNQRVSVSEDAMGELSSLAASYLKVGEIAEEPADVQLEWAIRHAGEKPRLAYRIMNTAGYEGTELIVAAKGGLMRGLPVLDKSVESIQGLRLSEISLEDLDGFYPELRIETRHEIARLLEDRERIAQISRDYALLAMETEIPNRSRKYLGNAYDIWLGNDGSLDDPHFVEVRSRIIDHETSGKHYSRAWLRPEDDPEARVLLHDALLTDQSQPRFLKGVYELAEEIGDDARMVRTKRFMLDQDPLRALNVFEGNQDEAGVTLAVASLAETYGVDEGTLMETYTRLRE